MSPVIDKNIYSYRPYTLMDDQIRIVVERQNPWWQGISYRTGINRLGWYPDILRFLSIPEILILLGPRRSGKSTLLYQVINKCILDGTPPAHILYLNFDDAVLMSKSRDPAFLITLIESYKNEHTKLSYIFMDEIQNAEFWAQITVNHEFVANGVQIPGKEILELAADSMDPGDCSIFLWQATGKDLPKIVYICFNVSKSCCSWSKLCYLTE